jgi:hypothetical protein
MLHDFAVAIATFIIATTGALVSGAHQMSSTVASLFTHHTANSVETSQPTSQTAAAVATAYNPDPFGSAGTPPGTSPAATSSPTGSAAPNIVNNYITRNITGATPLPSDVVRVGALAQVLAAFESNVNARFTGLSPPSCRTCWAHH